MLKKFSAPYCNAQIYKHIAALLFALYCKRTFNIKLFTLLVFIFVPLILFTGCWDSVDIQERNIIVSVGIDYLPEDDEYLLIVETASIRSINMAEENTKTGSTSILKGKGKNIADARQEIDRGADFPIYLGSTRVVIFTKRMAANGIESYLNRIRFLNEYRKTIDILTTDNEIEDLYGVKPENDLSTGFELEDTIYNLVKQGQAARATAADILGSIALGRMGYVIPYIRVRDNAIKLSGYSIFKKSKQIEIIPVEKANGMVYMLNDKARAKYTVETDSNVYTFDVKLKNKKIKVSMRKGQPLIEISMKLNPTLTFSYYLESLPESKIKNLENRINELIKDDIKYITDVSKKLNCDFLGFYKYFSAQHPDMAIETDWENIYRDAIVKINIESALRQATLIDPDAQKPK